MDRAELERALTQLAHEIDFPPTPALVTGVREGIARGEDRSLPLMARRHAWLRPALTVAVLALAIFGAFMVFSPAARHAVADFLGIEGARIEIKATPVPTTVPTLGEDLDLGDEVTLAEAEDLAGFKIKIPPALGEPDAVYSDPFTARVVSLVYEASDEFPESASTGVGLLISEFEGTIGKGELLDKIVFTGGKVAPVKVNGQPGFWISGSPHTVYFRDDAGLIIDDTTRLAGNTLLWESGDLTMRLEGDITKAEALRIARSLP
jgi:hypothetical protein